MDKLAISDRILEVLAKIQQKILMVLIFALPLLVTVQVILRYVLHLPLMGIEELMLFPTIWLYMLGGSNASRERNHIECGILSLYIKKEKSIAIFKVIKTSVAFIVSVWLTYWAWWYFAYSLKMWKISDLLHIPMFFGESALFIGLFLMTMYAGIELYDMVQILRGHLGYKSKGGVKC
ncbi:TRAP transporter small permease [Clostridium sp.]|jgi:TRAP-type C4-dicarboxylate transport system permease small subunit|uniref:TRAP transporter small permease n=1 Tax=Clostridium sp. TaxID=1506 RepID=UPI003EEEECBC